jgi:hypothetical protein
MILSTQDGYTVRIEGADYRNLFERDVLANIKVTVSCGFRLSLSEFIQNERANSNLHHNPALSIYACS